MFWGIAAITAAEMNLPQAPSSYGTWDWLALAEGVFRDQTSGNNVGWDTTACGGGVRWQKFFYQGGGYYMKNSISNGGLFQLVARLYRYTGNSEYKDWAEKIWNWSVNSPLVNNQTWNVADSTQMQDDCTSQGNTQFSYNYGTYLMGCAYMYNSVSIHSTEGPCIPLTCIALDNGRRAGAMGNCSLWSCKQNPGDILP